jgi:hypothetical protein
VRQPRNPNSRDFRYVLERTSTPFFMFAAGDDHWHPDYAGRMIEALDREPTESHTLKRGGGVHVVFRLSARTMGVHETGATPCRWTPNGLPSMVRRQGGSTHGMENTSSGCDGSSPHGSCRDCSVCECGRPMCKPEWLSVFPRGLQGQGDTTRSSCPRVGWASRP